MPGLRQLGSVIASDPLDATLLLSFEPQNRFQELEPALGPVASLAAGHLMYVEGFIADRTGGVEGPGGKLGDAWFFEAIGRHAPILRFWPRPVREAR